jgi:hypothetical protein
MPAISEPVNEALTDRRTYPQNRHCPPDSSPIAARFLAFAPPNSSPEAAPELTASGPIPRRSPDKLLIGRGFCEAKKNPRI